MRLLIAGMTGQLGAGLVDVAQDVTIVPLLRPQASRRHPASSALLGEALYGNVAEPLWGLPEETVEGLEVDAVVNLAGQTNWSAGTADLMRTNFLGAEQGFALAKRLGVPYVHASSIYVAGGMLGTIPEALLPSGTDRTAYEQSKWLAEHRLGLLAREPGAPPVLIARVCALVGDSRTGQTLKRSSLYLLADRYDDLPAGVLPAMRGARVDALPRDIAAAELLQAVRAMAGRPPGEAIVCHLGAGETAPTLRSLLAAAHALDPMRFGREPRTVSVPSRPLIWLTQNADRFSALSASQHNSMIGLRYVAMDRMFPRGVLAGLTGRRPPKADVDLLASLVFGVARARYDEPRNAGLTTLGRFPG